MPPKIGEQEQCVARFFMREFGVQSECRQHFSLGLVECGFAGAQHFHRSLAIALSNKTLIKGSLAGPVIVVDQAPDRRFGKSSGRPIEPSAYVLHTFVPHRSSGLAMGCELAISIFNLNSDTGGIHRIRSAHCAIVVDPINDVCCIDG